MLGLWGFAVATAFLPGIYSAPFMPRWWAFAIGIAFVPRLDLRRIDERILWCMGIALLWSGLTLLWTPALYGGGLLFGFTVLFCVAVVASASATQEDRELGLNGFALGIALSAAIGLGQRFFGYSGVIEAIPNQAAGLFFNREVFAEVSAPIAVWCALQRDYPHRILAVLMGAAIVASQERI